MITRLDVICTYKKGRVVCSGKDSAGKAVNLVLEIPSKELSKMYFGKSGEGNLTVTKEEK